MKFIAAHTYYGGMELGAAQVMTSLGCAETWKKSIGWRKMVGRPALTVEQALYLASAKRPEVVLANPPCSRFSCMSSSTFGADKYTDLKTYPELLHCIELVKASPKCRLLWWETGPLAWKQSEAICRAMEQALGWEHSLIIRHDPRSVGVPQRRVRCHIIHSEEEINTQDVHYPVLGDESIGSATMPDPVTAEEHCVRSETGEGECRMETDDLMPPSTFIPLRHQIQTFMANMPRFVEEETSSVAVVLSGRFLGWKRRDRWLTSEELARLMGAPAEEMKLLPNQWERLTALSKGVCVNVARDVALRWVLPTLEGRGRVCGSKHDFTRPDKYYDKLDRRRQAERA